MADGRRRQGFALAAVARQVSEMWWNKTGQDLDPAVWHRLIFGSKFYCAEDNKRILDLLLKAMRSGVSKRAMDAAVAQSDNLDDFLSRIGIDPREYYEPQENQAA